MRNILDKKFDITFVATIYLTEDLDFFSGGAEVHLRNVVNVVKKDKRVLILQKTYDEDRLIQKEGVSVLFLKAKNDLHYKLRVRKLLSNIATVQVHFNYLGLSDFVSRRKNVLYTGTFHGIGWDFPISNFPEPYVVNSYKNRVGAFCAKVLEIVAQVRALRKLDKILSVDSSLLRFAQQFVTSKRNRVEVVSNFADTSRFVKNSKLNKQENFTILYPRNISFARGVHLLVPIANYLREHKLAFKFHIVGGGIAQIGGNKYESLLHEEIKRNDLDDFFVFLGRVRHEDMPKMFLNANVVIIPTYFSEGTSLSCLEAMASFRPVITTNIGGLNDLVINNNQISRMLTLSVESEGEHIYNLSGDGAGKWRRIV